MHETIYFDNASTTPPIDDSQLSKFYDEWYMNPSSPHTGGIAASRALHKAREKIFSTTRFPLGAITFTSGGTEANNLALLGYARTLGKRQLQIFAESWQHPSVIEPLKSIVDNKHVHATFVEHNNWQIPSHGHVLVALTHVSHETGDIYDVNTIASAIKKHNRDAVIHVDGVQGFCKDCLQLADIDMYSVSSHKLHGPEGVGFLYVKKGIKLKPLFYGGNQEAGLRSGTEPVNSITKLALIVESLMDCYSNRKELVEKVKSRIIELEKVIPDTHINSLSNNVSPYILNISFLGVKGEVLVHLLAERGVFASMGAACKSRKKEMTTLELMGFNRARAESAVRFSFSHLNTVSEAEYACNIIESCVSMLRRIS